MSVSATFGDDLLNLIFNNVAAANVGDASGLQPSATTGDLYIALHTADPTSSGNQSSNEAAYTGYARVVVARTSSGWTVSGLSVTNTGSVTFGACTAGSETETHFSIGTASTGTGEILLYGALTSSVAVSSGITPSFSAGNLSASVS